MAELVVIGFEGKHRAAEVLHQLEDMNASWTIDLKDAVVVYQTVQTTLPAGAAAKFQQLMGSAAH